MKKPILNRSLIAPTVLCLLPFVFSVVFYSRLPESVVIHFDFQGQPDGFTSRAMAAFGLPALLFAIYIFAVFMMNADPKRQGVPSGVRMLMIWLVPLLSVVTHGIMIAYALGIVVDVEFVLSLAIGLTLVVLGNFLPKCRQNYAIGIRLPWTLNSEQNWRYTHRLAGFLYVLGGIVMIANAFAGTFWLAYTMLAVLMLAPVIASYIYHKRHDELTADMEDEE